MEQEHIIRSKKKMKILIRVKDKSTRTWKWAHLCYLPASLCERYFVAHRKGFIRLKLQIIAWTHQDFGVKVILNSTQSVEKFKSFITNSYKKRYQELFPKDGFSFSNNGWLALWLTQHMEMEMEDDLV